MAKNNKIKENWKLIPGLAPTEMDLRILEFQNRGKLCPIRDLIKNQEQIEGIRRSGKVNTALLDMLSEKICAGMTTAEIDRMVYDFTTAHGAIPAPLNYEGFPKSVCTSINNVVCHGIPNSKQILKNGDIINVDCTTILNGYFSDSSRMYCIGEVSEDKKRLVEIAKKSIEVGLEQVKPWGFLGDMGQAINDFVRENGYTVVREIGGHGIGLEFHEEPWVAWSMSISMALSPLVCTPSLLASVSAGSEKIAKLSNTMFFELRITMW